MKPTSSLRAFLALTGSALLLASQAHAVTYYWDSNGTTAGLGDTAGTWGSSALFRTLDAATGRGVINGTLATFASQNGASGDTFYFGTANLSLGTTASTIGIVGAGVTTGNIVFGAGQGSQGVTLSGGGGTITLLSGAAAPIIASNNTGTNTIGAVLAGSNGLAVYGPGNLLLTGANTFTGGANGLIVRNGGTLQVGNGTSGSLTSQALTFKFGGGTFNARAVDAGSTQAMGALLFSTESIGVGTVQSTYGTSGNAELSFTSLSARGAGATGNFVVSGGSNGTTNKIVLGGAATGFLDKGLFFGGSSYAAYDATGYVRGLIYGTDTNAAASDTITASNHVQLTSSPAARTGDTLLSLNLSGGGVDYTMNAGSLTVPAILKSGGGSVSTISGGTSLTTASNAELVIRTDTASDLLTISSAVTGFSGGLTKTGAGTLTLSGGNGYTGATTINAGTLALSGGSAIVDTQAVVLANAAGSTLQLNASETILNVTGGGFTGGNVNVQGNTLTLASAASYAFGGQFTGTSAGGVIKQGAGTLTLSNKNTFAGAITLEAGALEFSYGNDGSGTIIPLSSGGAFNMANGTTLRFSPTANLLAGTVGDSLGAVNGGTPAYPYGWTVTNDINIASGTTTANIRVGGNENSIRFSGNVTGGTSGAQTLAIFAGGIATGAGDRQPNVFSGTIANGIGGTLGVNVDFAGASGTAQNVYVSLSGQNTFTGPIVVTNSKGLTGAGAGYLGLGGEIHSTGPTFITGTGHLGGGNYTNTIALATGTKLAYLSSANQILGGAISGGGELIKRGSGTLTLSAANGFTGATTITEGTLDLGGSTANGSLASTVLNMGGATLNYTRTGGTTQAITTTNITAGANTITAVAGNTLTLGSLVKTGAATVNFGTTGTITTSTANDASGILGGWATFGGTNWAVANGAGSAITGFAGTYDLTSVALNVAANYASKNISVDSSQAPGAGITPNTLTFNTAGAYTLTLFAGSTNTIPGILVNSVVGNNASLITGGTALRGTSGGTLNIIQNNTTGANSALTIGSIITSNSSSGLNKSGAGTLILTAANTYTGATFIEAGTLQLGNGGSTGSLATTGIVNNGSLVVNRSGTLTLPVITGTGSVTNTSSTLTLNSGNTFSGGFTLNSGGFANFAAGTFTGFGTGTVTINGGTLTGVSGSPAITINNNMAWNSVVTLSRASSGAPTWTFNGDIVLGANSGYANGSTTVSNNVIFNGDISETGGARSFTASVGSIGGNGITFNGQNTFTGAITVPGSTYPVKIGGSGYLGGGNYAGAITLAGASFTYSSSANQTLGGNISGSGTTLTKDTSATSTLTLTATNGYTGATAVNAGTLAITGTGSINNTSSLTVAAGAKLTYNSSTALTVAPTLNGSGLANRAVLGGTGPINVSVTLNNVGDTLSPGNSPGIESFTVGQSWAAFSYDWEVNDFSDTTGLTAGSDFDQIGITGGLTLTGAAANSYYLNILSLTAGNVTGDAANFSEINRSWNILTTTTGITGFNASYWNLNTTGFTNVEGGNWSIAQSGNNLVLSYTVVPEPRAALLGGIGMLMLLRRRRH